MFFLIIWIRLMIECNIDRMLLLFILQRCSKLNFMLIFDDSFFQSCTCFLYFFHKWAGFLIFVSKELCHFLFKPQKVFPSFSLGISVRHFASFFASGTFFFLDKWLRWEGDINIRLLITLSPTSTRRRRKEPKGTWAMRITRRRRYTSVRRKKIDEKKKI